MSSDDRDAAETGDAFWWTPWFVLAGLLAVGVLGYMGKIGAGPTGPTAADVATAPPAPSAK